MRVTGLAGLGRRRGGLTPCPALCTQEVRQILNPAVGSSQADGAVTAIDVAEGTDYAVCGYFSGKVILWDIMTGAEVKVR